ncbi:DNA gyrase inhibitor YacG [Rhizobium sp. Pop5]|uniref:DNA gyrase inhibitor YacG n=1 Tax=Rhizobium sp. Pop5 TaxID=1223565 RepID=UPI000283C348|nr:DNA gyrase inhibitor YacG [Rhizobium sp. Pop5]EJZ22451.1 zinc-binding protein [Rhizobium sp. Pop5]UVD57243.1 DNA gyrase inhibitor YacG [Rhizobium sp. Pop5]
MPEDKKAAAKVEPLRKTRPCPECGKPSSREHYPFCSNRCREVDLSRWLTGSYAIPVADDETKADFPDEEN